MRGRGYLFHTAAALFALPVLIFGCGGGNSLQQAPPPPGNPVPSISSVSPATISAGASAVTITVVGSSFVSGAAVSLDGIRLTTQFVSSTQLTASVPSGTQIVAGKHAVTATNPSPGGGTSTGSAQLTIAPTLAGITPSGAPVGSSISIAIYGGDLNTPANNVITFTQAGRTFETRGASATVSNSQTSQTIVSVTIPTGLAPSTAVASIGAPATLSGAVNSIPGDGVLPFEVEPPPHISAIWPSSAEPGTSFQITILGSFTNFDSNSKVTTDDLGLSITDLSVTSERSINATLNVDVHARTGNHIVSVGSSGATLNARFIVVEASSGVLSLNLLSTDAAAPMSPLKLTGIGFSGDGQKQTSLVVRYSTPSGMVAEVPAVSAGDTEVGTFFPLLPDADTGNIYTGDISVELLVNGRASNALPMLAVPLPANAGPVGQSTLTYLDRVSAQLNSEKGQMTHIPGLPSEQALSILAFLDAVQDEVTRVRGQVTKAVTGASVIAPDGSTFSQGTVDVFDRLLQSSNVLAVSPLQAGPLSHVAMTQLTGTVATETAMAAAGATCKATDTLSDIVDVLDKATSYSCAASLVPILAPVFGPVCGFLKLLETLSLADKIMQIVCDVAPINLQKIDPNPQMISEVVSGPSVTEMPTATFASSAGTNTAETVSDLILDHLDLDKTVFRVFITNKIVSALLEDAFDEAFSRVYANYLDTSAPIIFFFPNPGVPLTSATVALRPDPNGFADFSGLTVMPKGTATKSTQLYFDTSAFRSLDCGGQVTVDSTQVCGNDHLSLIVKTVTQISPTFQAADPGEQVQFSATVAGVGDPFQDVSWSVDGIPGGNSVVGTISSSGLYTATIIPGGHEVEATSGFDGSVGTASVAVGGVSLIRTLTVMSTNPNSGVAVTASPADGTNQTGGNSPLTLTYSDGTTVTLTAPPTAGGNNFSTWTGCDSTSGFSCTVTLTADRTTVANYAASSIGTVTLSPASITVPIGGAQSFIASVVGSNNGVTWTVLEGAGGGTIGNYSSISATYIPPNTIGTFHVVAASVDNPAEKATAVVTVTSAVPVDVLHSFQGPGKGDGGWPVSGLVQANDGNFYGTTYGGGTVNDGTVFKLDNSGALTILYSFPGAEGGAPAGNLIQGSDGDLYGTTYYGGASGLGGGTVFKTDLSGSVTVLHSFVQSGADGTDPYAGLVQAKDGYFYGTTFFGGAANAGTTFKMDASGNVTSLHSFSGTDGAAPYAGLIQAADGNFYGTTYYGGSSGLGNGAVYRMDASGAVTVLHGFSWPDGELPFGGVIQASDGNFYGTTLAGGAWGSGTVFKIDPAGHLTVLHSFSQSDGAGPIGALIQAKDGSLYGTTSGGGALLNGTIFKMDLLGNLTVLHSFSGSDGANPYAGVVQGTDGNLYGTTQYGGAAGIGVVFRLDLSGLSSTAQVKAQGPDRLRISH